MLKKSVVIRTNKLKLIKPDYLTLILFSLFICGVIIGASIVKKGDSDFSSFIENLIANNLSAKHSASMLTVFCNDFLWLALLVFVCGFFGFCGFGMPFVFVMISFFGVICGCSFGGFLINYGLQGIGYFCLINLPCYAITAATLIKCCCESLKFSFYIFTTISGIKSSQTSNKNLLKNYLISFLILCLPIIAGVLLSTIAFKLFGDLFSII